jgi:hypothetical protein
MRTIRVAFALAFFTLFATSALAQSDASKAKYDDIRTLLGLLNVGPQMRQNLIDQIDQERAAKDPEVPAAFWDEFEKEALNSLPEYIERLIPTYDETFTHSEIKTLIKLHQEPAMAKLMRSQNALAEAHTKAGEKWGEELGMKVAQRMESGEEAPAQKTKQPAKKKK